VTIKFTLKVDVPNFSDLCLAKTPSASNIGRYSLVLTVKSGSGLLRCHFGEAQQKKGPPKRALSVANSSACRRQEHSFFGYQVLEITR
jgi:hypothetical protein